MTTDPKNISWSIPHYLDASVTVKLVVTEEGSALLQHYLIRNWSYHFHITEFAFYETLFVLKQKLLRNDIDKKGYFAAVAQLAGYLEDRLLQIDTEFQLDNLKVVFEVGEMVNKYSLDYSDALQIYTVLKGQWSGSRFHCTAVFVTVDSKLAEAARREGLRVWNPLKEPDPPDWDNSSKGKVSTS